jgi:hypothetical protein
MKKYKLTKHIRYRREDGYVLLCDCKRLLDFEVPTKHLELLNKLEKGYKPQDEIEKQFVKEFEGLDLLKNNNRNEFKEDIFENLTYDENEFV